MDGTKLYRYHNTAYSMEQYLISLHFPNLLINGYCKQYKYSVSSIGKVWYADGNRGDDNRGLLL